MRTSHFLVLSTVLLAACNPASPTVDTSDSGVAKPDTRPDITVLDYTAKGSPDAPILFVEYSDYQCPFCRKFTMETLPDIMTKYVNTGLVRFVFKDFPLEVHGEAIEAAVASHCAGELGEFYPYHDLLFEKAADRDIEFTRENFVAWAGELGMDEDKFDLCLDDPDQLQKVANSTAEAKSFGVIGTPSFMINSRLFKGPQPLAAFSQVIENLDDLPQVDNPTCSTTADCNAAFSMPQYCSKSLEAGTCITTGTPTCMLPGTAESECVMIITEECTPCTDGEVCSEGACIAG